MADKKLTALSAATTPTDDDIMYIVNDPASTPASFKITWANVKATLKTYFDTLYVVAGTVYTPTLTNTTNIDASTAISCRYIRVGVVVQVSGMVQVDPTATASTVLGFSLPIASNLASAIQCNGIGFSSNGNVPVYIAGDTTNDRATFTFTATATANQNIYFTFSYQIA